MVAKIRIYAQPQSITQDDQSFFKYTRLPVTSRVKLSLNFELLVNRVMKFLLASSTFFVQLELFRIQ